MATTENDIASYFPITLLLLTSPLLLTFHGFATADQTPVTTAAPTPLPQNCSISDSSAMSCEIQDLKLKAAKLELLLEMTELEIYTKSGYIAKYEKKIEEVGLTINQLVSDFANVKEAPDYEQMIYSFEEQVWELEADVQSNDGELRLLKARIKDAENRVDLLASQVKAMSVIVPELWFHVQKLEQAQEVIERRTGELRRHMRNQKCLFFKSVNKIFGQRYQEMIAAYTSEAVNCLQKSFSSIKKYHHQVQGLVRQEMGKHDLTAVLAGDESVFVLASVIFLFPIMLAWICLSSHWR